jgi:hypothetical protein
MRLKTLINFVPAFTIAIAYLILGDNDKAIETLEAASKMDGMIFLNRELDLWFIFDPSALLPPSPRGCGAT